MNVQAHGLKFGNMLFAVKRHAIHALAACFALVALSLLAKAWLDLVWSLAIPATVTMTVFVGLLLVALSDGVVHGVLWLTWRERYLSRYRALIHFFTPQDVPAIFMGGLLAASEELFFRGVLLETVLAVLKWGPLPAILLSSAVFMLFHLPPQRGLALFAIWSFWESMLLGTIYLWSDSLLVALLVHGLHDIAGFTIFTLQRRTSWFVGQQEASFQKGAKR